MTDSRPAGAPWELAATREFFAPRAAGWEARFPDDGPAYRRAVDDLAPRPGDLVLDAGCGTGRALDPLRRAVGPAGTVIGLDATPEMLAEARALGREAVALLILGDVRRLPLPDGVVGAVFAAGLLAHLPDPLGGLAELARVSRPGGRLALFHPLSRSALAAKRGGQPSDDDTLAPRRLAALLAGSGWELASMDDGVERYLALAVRLPGSGRS